MELRLAVGIAFAAMLVQAAPVAATPVNVTAATRQVEVGSAEADFLGPNSPSSAFGSFSDSVTQTLGGELTSADQSSNIQNSTGLFTGTGDASVGFSVLQTDAIFANSVFDVFFEITTDHSYGLTGQLDAGVDGGRAEARFHLEGPTSLDFDTIGGLVPLASSGILLAGSYHLAVSAVMDNGGTPQEGSFMGGSGSFGFEFQLTEGGSSIPEPASLALVLASAIGGLGFSERMRRTLYR